MSGLEFALASLGLVSLIVISIFVVAAPVLLAMDLKKLQASHIALDQACSSMAADVRDLQQTTGNDNHRIDGLYGRAGDLASRIESALASIDAVMKGLRGVELTMAEIEKKISEHEELHGTFTDWRMDLGQRLHAAEVRLRAIQEGNREHDTPKKYVGDLVTDTGVQLADGE